MQSKSVSVLFRGEALRENFRQLRFLDADSTVLNFNLHQLRRDGECPEINSAVRDRKFGHGIFRVGQQINHDLNQLVPIDQYFGSLIDIVDHLDGMTLAGSHDHRNGTLQ